MQKKSAIYRALFVLTFVVVPLFSFGQSTKEHKEITKNFKLNGRGQLEISNKYGQISLLDSSDDSVRIVVNVTAYGKDYSAARKSLNRIDFDIRQSGQYITAETVFDRKSGVVKDIFNSIGDYSKSLLSKNKLEITYEVQVPSYVRVSIENKFGDVYLQSRKSNTDVRISHGNLRANKLDGVSEIEVSYGDVTIKHIEEGNFILKAVDRAEIKEANEISIKSSSSDIRLGTINRLKMESRGDKRYSIEKINHINGSTSFTNLEVAECSKSLDVTSSYGEIAVEYMPYNFSYVQLKSKSTDINIIFDNQSWIETNIEVKEENLTISGNNSTLKKAYLEDKKGIVRITGFLGRKNIYSAQLGLRAHSGSIKLNLNGDSKTAKK